MSHGEEFHWVEGGVKLPNGRFKRHILIDLRTEDMAEFKERYDNTGIYYTAYRYNKPKQDEAELYGDLYLDFDANSDDIGYEQVREDALRALAFFSAIFGISSEDIKIFFSGKKGIHLIIPARALDIKPDKELNDIFRLIAKDVHTVTTYKTVDLRIYDRVRLFRVVNSKHPDTGLYKVPITYQQLSNLSYDEIKSRAKRPRRQRNKTASYNMKAARVYTDYIAQWEKEKTASKNTKNGERTIDFTPPCIKHIFQNGAAEGKRNNTAAALASHFKQRGYSEEKTYQKLKNWNDKMCVPRLSDREINTTLQSIYKGGYTYGCRTLEDISICDRENCKLAKKQ